MDTSLLGPLQECARCRGTLAPAALVCTSCHALVHSSTLDQLATAARAHETRQEWAAARDVWLQALELLPAQSSQAEWIRSNVHRFQGLIEAAPPASASGAWIRKLGPFAPLFMLLAKGKFLLSIFELKFVFSLGAFVAFYWSLWGAWFGIGFAGLILLHELGHFVEIKRRGLPADMQVFLPGFGAYVRWTALGVSLRTRALISLAGPMAGLIGAVVCALLWSRTGNALWIGLASLSAVLNVFNLIPVWVLDGGQAIAALDRNERIILAAGAVALAAYFEQPLFLLVAAGAAYRVFTRDIPLAPDKRATVYYLLILAALGYVITLSPMPIRGT